MEMSVRENEYSRQIKRKADEELLEILQHYEAYREDLLQAVIWEAEDRQLEVQLPQAALDAVAQFHAEQEKEKALAKAETLFPICYPGFQPVFFAYQRRHIAGYEYEAIAKERNCSGYHIRSRFHLVPGICEHAFAAGKYGHPSYQCRWCAHHVGIDVESIYWQAHSIPTQKYPHPFVNCHRHCGAIGMVCIPAS
jgi:hypothetical protein